MANPDLAAIYRHYIACLNRQDRSRLAKFVDDDVHNGRRIGLSGYRDMLEQDFSDIPDLHFGIRLLTCYREPLELRLHTEGDIPRPRRQRTARPIYRECLP